MKDHKSKASTEQPIKQGMPYLKVSHKALLFQNPSFIKMKVSILGLLTLSAFASACASYESCHCYDSNGIPNNGATKTVCDHFNGGTEPNTREYGANT
ncbi:hypothetical protein H9Q74_011193 [Fusarium xylarioides]|nr:hypothetical protein H9Q74_011193 [Fusarium xylarioides]